MSPSGKATKRSEPMERSLVLERLMVSPKGAATSKTAAKASSARGADRATTAVSSAYSMSKKGTTGVRIRSRRDRRRSSASDMSAERTTTNRKGDSVHPCLMPPLCALSLDSPLPPRP
eukprot:8569542-Alexandrium_andersonii.AAC.1